MVKVSPQMNLDVEQLDYPGTAVGMLMLEASVDENGLVLSGMYINPLYNSITAVSYCKAAFRYSKRYF